MFRYSFVLNANKECRSSLDVKVKDTRKVGGAVSSRFIFVFALSQFTKPDYLGAWNRLLVDQYNFKISGCYNESCTSIASNPIKTECV